MFVPLSWLREFTPVEMPTDDLTHRLTLAGLEVAAIQRIGEDWDRETILVGKITAVRPHPNADRLKLVDVDYGKGRSATVVTGAPNLGIGQKPCVVPLALAGAELWDPYSETPKKAVLKPTKLRGVESAGMVCSEKELGISDEHTGIMILPDDAPVGKPLTDYLGEEVLEIELTPNLGHCLSIVGVAREVAALTKTPLTIHQPEIHWIDPPADREVEIAILDPDLASRYCGIVIDDLTVAPSPFFIAWRLRLVGQRPINNLVDVTNYVMFERGQPLHAFDLETIAKGPSGKRRIEVRKALAGELLVTLDGQKRTLDPEILVIADPKRAVALAGVMGGLDTEVTESTSSMLLEAATFDLVSIRQTSRRLKLPSEASLRFGKGLWPEAAEEGALRAAELLAQVGGGKIRRGIVQDYPRPPKKTVIHLGTGEVERILGLKVSSREMTDHLSSLGFEAKDAKDYLEVTPPPWRLDCSIPADLVEEIVRSYGYDRLPERLLPVSLPARRQKREPAVFKTRARDNLVRLGLEEIITYSMVSPDEINLFGHDPQDSGLLRLVNPLSQERSILRPSLLITLLETLGANFRYADRLAHFEIGKVFGTVKDKPWEEDRIAIGMGGPRQPLWWGRAERETIDLFDLKGVVENFLTSIGIVGWQITAADLAILKPGRALEVMVNNRGVGYLGEVADPIRAFFDLPEVPVLVAELNLKPLEEAAGPRKFSPPLRYPPAIIDLGLVIPDTYSAADVMDRIRKTAGPLLRDLVPFDLYRGPQVPDGHRSVAFRLTFQSPEKSLTDKQVLSIRGKILKELEPLGIRLR